MYNDDDLIRLGAHKFMSAVAEQFDREEMLVGVEFSGKTGSSTLGPRGNHGGALRRHGRRVHLQASALCLRRTRRTRMVFQNRASFGEGNTPAGEHFRLPKTQAGREPFSQARR